MAEQGAPIGAIEEIRGSATILHADGTSEPATLGTPVYLGDVIETAADAAVNITFLDDTSFAVSEGARFSIDEYSFDPATESGTSDFSVLQGVFVFTSGLIGRDDPDDVKIETPVGSIGIRGTIIAGKINPDGDSEITVVEGAIVVKNGVSEITLAQQFESVKLGDFNSNMQPLGVLDARDVGSKYNVISNVTPSLFSNVQDAAGEQAADETSESGETSQGTQETGASADQAASDAQVENSEAAESSEESSDTNTQTQPAQESNGTEPAQESRAAEPAPEPVIVNPAADTSGLNNTAARAPAPVAEVLRATDSAAQESRAAAHAGAHNTAGPAHTPPATTTTTSRDAPIVSPTVYQPQPTVVGDTTLHLRSPNAPNVHILNDYSNNHANKIGTHFYAAGDLNGDGLEDFYFYNDGSLSGQTHAYAVYGKLGGFGDNEVIRLVDPLITTPGDPDANAGEIGVLSPTVSAPSALFDFNGDGKYSDSYTANPSFNSNMGQVVITLDNAKTVTVTNGLADMTLGENVSMVGDFNGDGKSDMLISLDSRGDKPDTALILFGKDVATDVTIGAGSFGTGSVGTKVSVAPGMAILSGNGVGDFNGDGFDDIGLAVRDHNGVGHIYVVYGGNMQYSLNWETLNDSANAYHIVFGAVPAGFDVNLGAVGDYNGDGFDDFAVGFPDAEGNHGLVAIVDGRKTLTNTLVGDNIAPYINNASLVGTAGNDTLSDGARAGISMRGGAGNDHFHIGSMDFRNIDGGTGYDTIDILGDNRILNFGAIDFERITGIEKLMFRDDAQQITLTVENIFNLLHTSDDGTFKIDLNADSGTLKIDALTATGGSVANIISALAQGGDTVTHDTAASNAGFDVFHIGDNNTLYINQDISVQVI